MGLLFTSLPRPPTSTLFPYTTLFRSDVAAQRNLHRRCDSGKRAGTRRGHHVAPDGHHRAPLTRLVGARHGQDRKSTRLNSSHLVSSYAAFCLNKKKDISHRKNTPTST